MYVCRRVVSDVIPETILARTLYVLSSLGDTCVRKHACVPLLIFTPVRLRSCEELNPRYFLLSKPAKAIDVERLEARRAEIALCDSWGIVTLRRELKTTFYLFAV